MPGCPWAIWCAVSAGMPDGGGRRLLFVAQEHTRESLEEIRREETRELRAAGDAPVLRKARWCLL